MIQNMEIKFPFLRFSVSAYSTSSILRDGDALLCTLHLESSFELSEDGSNFAASSLVGKISSYQAVGKVRCSCDYEKERTTLLPEQKEVYVL